MHRFFFAPEALVDGSIWLDEEESHHLTQVIRQPPGATVLAFDGQGREFAGRVVEVTRGVVHLGNLVSTGESREACFRLCLLQGIAKGDKMDWIVQKATELGVAEIVPVITERTIIKFAPQKAVERQKRWQKIAREACKQSRRTVVPQVAQPQPWPLVMAEWPLTRPLVIPWEEEQVRGLRSVLKQLPANCPGLGVAIGPEGGFTSEEVGRAVSRGGRVARLGPRILRTETAGLAAITAIMYELGDWG
ncbi:MAG: 16S rRNA (uracil(1498)-N(3))-methyltransferase [Heliobacteriaceae bacterium]|nr:16S rRNA (uracil(1498)-N(3))-methyltransferase [Heliobacteriaceae bacterium]MDD4586864.1 16S rRNA (uracil(1498)-N(3))-methyltransferase [Heliobacteriaceae bacterium]